MKKEQGRKLKAGARKASAKKRSEQKKVVKMRVTGNTEILDLDLLEEETEKQQKPGEKALPEKSAAAKAKKKTAAKEEKSVKKLSKAAVKEYGEQMPDKPVSLGDETLELLELDELLGQEENKEKVSKPKSRRESGSKKAVRSAKTPPAPERKRRKSDFGAMDLIIAMTGVLVLFVAVVTFGIYHNAAETEQQVEAVAQVGMKMEEIGVAGEDIFVAVADARIAAQELAREMAEESEAASGEYEEKDLVSSVNVTLKLTSVQKDLKIKFTNKETGKLIGNQAFQVKIEGPEKLTKTDDDKDGIIYISSITPGEYTVSITAPEQIDGNAVAGIKGVVTVKDQIEYKKIDVADEVKKESEINAAKEDTAVAPPVESVITDTVEWVESTKTPIGSGVTYEEVKKSDIPEPSTVAMLDMIWTKDGKSGAYLSTDTVKLSQNAASFGQPALTLLKQGVYFTQETEISPATESTQEPSETEPKETEVPELTVKSVSISGGGDYYIGETAKLEATAETEGSLSGEEYQWSGDVSGSGSSISFTVTEEKSYSVTVTVKGVSATVTVNGKKKAAEVESIALTADSSSVEAGKSVTVKAAVNMNDGSSYGGSVEWSADGGQISANGSSATLTCSEARSVRVTAKAGGKESSMDISFYAADKKVTGIKIPGSVSVAVGATAGLSLDVQPSDAKDRSVTWKVTEGGEFASVDGNGTVKGLKAGTAKVQATANDGSSIASNVCTVTVAADIGVSLEAPGSMTVGEEKTLKCSTSGEIASVAWSISDSSIAQVDKSSGKVKALKAGKTTVTVKVTGKNGKEVSAAGELTVNAASVGDIKLDPSSATIKVGEKVTMKATVSTNGNKAVDWKVSDESIAKIAESSDSSCVVQALKPGVIKLTATSRENKEKTAEAKVTVELKDGSALLKDKNGNQLYYKSGDEYKEATAADYYKYDVFYRKKDSGQYLYTGWQTIDGKRYYFDKNGVPVTGEQVIQGMKYSFGSDGSLSVSGTMGIDVSKHNGTINWSAVKNSGVNYVIIRCGYRGSATGVLVEDPMFKTNIQGAISAGLKVGVYFFSQAVNEVEAVEEASMAVSLIRKYNITYPVYMDVEAANGRADGLNASARTQVIKAFCETIRNSGYTAGVYANKTWLNSMMNVGSLGSYKIWLAQYAATPTYSGRYEMWQYSSTGKIAGISGNVDLNISYMSY